MFFQKSKTDKAADKAAQASAAAANLAHTVRDRVVPAASAARTWSKPRAEAARDWTKPHAEAARDWARPHVEHGLGVAGPRLESAVDQLSPKVDLARDKLVEEVLPRISEALTALAATKADVVSRGNEAAYSISGGAVGKPKRKKGGVLIALGVLAAAGAAALAFLKKSSAPQDDPWATPLSEPYVPPASTSPSEAGIRAVDPELTGGSAAAAGAGAGSGLTADESGEAEHGGSGSAQDDAVTGADTTDVVPGTDGTGDGTSDLGGSSRP